MTTVLMLRDLMDRQEYRDAFNRLQEKITVELRAACPDSNEDELRITAGGLAFFAQVCQDDKGGIKLVWNPERAIEEFNHFGRGDG